MHRYRDAHIHIHTEIHITHIRTHTHIHRHILGKTSLQMQSPDFISTKAGKEAPRSCLEDQDAPWNASFLAEIFIQYLLILRLYFSHKLTRKPGMGGGGAGCEGNCGQAPTPGFCVNPC